MITEKKFSDTILYLFYFLPISILIGPFASLLNILSLSIFIFFLNLNKNFKYIFRNKVIWCLALIYIYLIFNTFISQNTYLSFSRNFGFLRFILLFIFINYFFFKKNNHHIFKFWTLILFIVIFDIFFEFFFGSNILGFSAENKKRIVSFFRDETVIGSYLNGFIFIIIGYFFSSFEKMSTQKKFMIFLFLLISFVSMVLTGERSNTIKLFIGLLIFFYLNDKIKLKNKVYFFLSVILFFLISLNLFSEIKHRYNNDLIKRLKNYDNNKEYIYFSLYKSGLNVFKEYPLFGVGNKNYREEACTNEIYLCNTHPHQIYIEFLSEHGIIGSLILISILFFLIFKNYNSTCLKKNYIQLGCFTYILIQFIPIIPSGAFFSDFNSTFFWINFSLLFAVNKQTNIFYRIDVK
jgi:O-antigen ligase